MKYPEDWRECKNTKIDICWDCPLWDNCEFKDGYRYQAGWLTKLITASLCLIALFVIAVAIFDLIKL